MRFLRFGTSLDFTLEEELRRPFHEVSVFVDRRLASVARLKRLDGSSLEIWSEMQDVAERVEVGVLQFQLVGSDGKRVKPIFTNTTYRTDDFIAENSLEKLVIQEEDCLAESGIIIRPAQGEDLVLVANAYPCHIALQGIPELDARFDPEYDLSAYRRLNFNQDLATISQFGSPEHNGNHEE